MRAVRAEQRNLLQHKSADPEADHHLALRLGRSAMAAAPDAQALMLPGGLWFAIHAAPLLEAEFGVPVLLNITATVVRNARRARIAAHVSGRRGRSAAGRLGRGWAKPRTFRINSRSLHKIGHCLV